MSWLNLYFYFLTPTGNIESPSSWWCYASVGTGRPNLTFCSVEAKYVFFFRELCTFLFAFSTLNITESFRLFNTDKMAEKREDSKRRRTLSVRKRGRVPLRGCGPGHHWGCRKMGVPGSKRRRVSRLRLSPQRTRLVLCTCTNFRVY